MKVNQASSILKRKDLIIHILCWGIVIFMPLLLYRPNDTFDQRIAHFFRSMGGTLAYMMIFYINYVWLVPKMFFQKRKYAFVLYNVVFVALAIFFSLSWWQVTRDMFSATQVMGHRHGRMGPPLYSMIFQSVLMQILFIGLSIAIRLSFRWQHLEEARREAEKSRTEAELSNLRNQLNPHFLLNTLNNIYALIAFDQDKAQEAVGDLSKLLRHVLYDNQQSFVPLYKEVAFMKNYIDLMKIRVTKGVKVTTDIDVAPDDSTPVAPLLFISLLENAFKHGIAQDGSGFIAMTIAQHDGVITCEISNSNHPKKANDKSGSGIGLEQVAKRLELIYPNAHKWEKGTRDDGTYFSKITLYTTQTR